MNPYNFTELIFLLLRKQILWPLYFFFLIAENSLLPVLHCLELISLEDFFDQFKI